MILLTLLSMFCIVLVVAGTFSVFSFINPKGNLLYIGLSAFIPFTFFTWLMLLVLEKAMTLGLHP